MRQRLGHAIYGTGKETLDEVVVRLLQQAGQRLALLETNTAGEMAQRLLALAWWDWSHEELRDALPAFRALKAKAFLDRYA